jgi:Cupin
MIQIIEVPRVGTLNEGFTISRSSGFLPAESKKQVTRAFSSERFEAGEGDVVSIPGGAAHAVVNITDKPARQFILICRAGGRVSCWALRGHRTCVSGCPPWGTSLPCNV